MYVLFFSWTKALSDIINNLAKKHRFLSRFYSFVYAQDDMTEHVRCMNLDAFISVTCLQ